VGRGCCPVVPRGAGGLGASALASECRCRCFGCGLWLLVAHRDCFPNQNVSCLMLCFHVFPQTCCRKFTQNAKLSLGNAVFFMPAKQPASQQRSVWEQCASCTPPASNTRSGPPPLWTINVQAAKQVTTQQRSNTLELVALRALEPCGACVRLRIEE
jgi:hypothetical protein